MNLDDLKPYQSLLLARIKNGGISAELITEVLDNITTILDYDDDRSLVNRVDRESSGGLDVGFIHYRDQKVPGWTNNENIKDQVNQLVLMCGKNGQVAIYCSDGAIKSRIIQGIQLGEQSGLGKLDLIKPGKLNAAYVTGETKTLWLSGTHRRVSVKADNKILSGMNLRDALDPLGDQTYHFTAARSLPTIAGQPVLLGVAPRKSSIWSGTSKKWADFTHLVNTVLDHLDAIQNSVEGPLPVLAVCSSSVEDIESPFDIGLISPELLSDDPQMDQEKREELEKWAYKTNFLDFVVTNDDVDEYIFEARVQLDKVDLGVVEFIIDFQNPEKVGVEVNEESVVTGHEDELKEVIGLLRKKTWLKVWFESGHTLCDGAVFIVRHRDIPFKKYIWADFSNFDVSKEKPDDLYSTGVTSPQNDSLFDWVVKNWPIDAGGAHNGAWLACDDGGGEMADFIHLDHRAAPPVLTLIHVKGAHSKSPTRGVSVSSYEVVTGQAVKNLRHLDQLMLSEGLADGLGKIIKELVWLDRKKAKREDLIDVLNGMGTNYLRKVVVLQPHLTKTKEAAARKNLAGQDYKRLRQLDTLLIGADSSCRDLQAEFIVIGDNI